MDGSGLNRDVRAHAVMKVVAQRGKAGRRRRSGIPDRNIGFSVQPDQPIVPWGLKLAVPDHAVQINGKRFWLIGFCLGQSRDSCQNTSGGKESSSIVHVATSDA